LVGPPGIEPGTDRL